MVICDGYNHIVPQALVTPTSNLQPFPRLPLNGSTLSGQLQETPKLSQSMLNGKTTNGHTSDLILNKPSKLPITPSSCNYDNLRNIDSDDSRLTSPDTFDKLSNSKPQQLITPILNLKLNNNNNNSTPLNNSTNNNQDKSLMNNIMNKSSQMNDSKSQSMFVNSNTATPNTNTPISSVKFENK